MNSRNLVKTSAPCFISVDSWVAWAVCDTKTRAAKVAKTAAANAPAFIFFLLLFTRALALSTAPQCRQMIRGSLCPLFFLWLNIWRRYNDANDLYNGKRKAP